VAPSVIVLIIPLVKSQFLAAAKHLNRECEKVEVAVQPSRCYTVVSNTGRHCLVHHVQTEASQKEIGYPKAFKTSIVDRRATDLDFGQISQIKF